MAGSSSSTLVTEVNLQFEAWMAVDQLLLGWLYNSMTPEVVVQVMRCESARTLWDSINELFGVQSRAEEDYLRALVSQVLLGLDEEYNAIVATIQSKENVSWLDMQSELLLFEKRAERKHRDIVEKGLIMLAQAFIPLTYWWEAFVYATYLINGMPTSVLQGTTTTPTQQTTPSLLPTAPMPWLPTAFTQPPTTPAPSPTVPAPSPTVHAPLTIVPAPSPHPCASVPTSIYTPIPPTLSISVPATNIYSPANLTTTYIPSP
ncbi:protein transport protein sec-16A.1-like [Benincasa hispida]|uniref:protein transport protein sec-16A.1-like n=1 Tax=Benincasa hispida TaxID=102211 RepID=UPI0019008431|nr:protein transport protein sec-16A.1-like [Benincasa hispida]